MNNLLFRMQKEYVNPKTLVNSGQRSIDMFLWSRVSPLCREYNTYIPKC